MTSVPLSESEKQYKEAAAIINTERKEEGKEDRDVDTIESDLKLAYEPQDNFDILDLENPAPVNPKMYDVFKRNLFGAPIGLDDNIEIPTPLVYRNEPSEIQVSNTNGPRGQLNSDYAPAALPAEKYKVPAKFLGATAAGSKARGRKMGEKAQTDSENQFYNLFEEYGLNQQILDEYPEKIVQYVYKPTAVGGRLNDTETDQLSELYGRIIHGLNYKMPTTSVLPTSNPLRQRIKKMIEDHTGQKAKPVPRTIVRPGAGKSNVKKELEAFLDDVENVIKTGNYEVALQLLENVQEAAANHNLQDRFSKLYNIVVTK